MEMDDNPYRSPVTRGEPKPERPKSKTYYRPEAKAAQAIAFGALLGTVAAVVNAIVR